MSDSGGGIGGLTCAVALSKYPDIDVDVYEAGPSFKQNGPGCGVWLRTWNILQKLELDQNLAQIAGTQPTDDPGSSNSYAHKHFAHLHRSFHIQLP
jgi:salicylate hydroxylase